ncbi:hypothetical protein Dsin_029490 [Dipteronia sinensis]|uniref:Uncharacterized protein n=1 Tax=Dipteronia sinensis TaxID=43782 RepID=A0AAD9ZT68_9ROSI|nr:hypothetical protein Dsin_029490 [Dipteronia sinensis]
MAASTLVVSSGGVPQMDAHHTIQMADIVRNLQTTQAPQNQLMNHSPPEPNSPLSDLLPRQNATIVGSTLVAGSQQIDSHDTVLTTESIDAHPIQAPQNQQNHAPIYQRNLPDRSLLPSQSENRDQYRHKCLPLKKAALADIALKLLEHQPKLAVTRDVNEDTALHVLARKPSSLFARRRIGIFKWLAYSIREMNTHNRELTSSPALELVKRLERAIEEQKANIEELIKAPSNLLFDAAKSGNFEFLAELIRSYPDLVHLLDEQERSIFHIAILHRHTDIFNLIYGIGFDKELLATYKDNEKNTMLHLAAKYPNLPPVSNFPGPALEMQQELLMFEASDSEMIHQHLTSRPPYQVAKEN